jgi:hypothetical protein
LSLIITLARHLECREMTRVRSSERLRLGALLALGAVVLHQLRYLVADGHGAAAALSHDGHGHLGLALPILLSIVLAIVASMLLVAAIARHPATSRDEGNTGRRALACALLLVAAFCGQELAEGALLSNHPQGVDALVRHGGLVVLPLAGLLGLLISLLVGVLGVAERRVAGALARPLRLPAQPPDHYSGPDVGRPVAFGLVFGSAQRAPPSLAARS